MHGTAHPLEERGPEDHPQGRCTRLTRTKSWAELGFDIEEPRPLLPDAQATFAALPRAGQLEVMGAKRLQLLDDGETSWTDLTRRQDNPGWRPSQTVTPLKDLTSAS